MSYMLDNNICNIFLFLNFFLLVLPGPCFWVIFFKIAQKQGLKSTKRKKLKNKKRLQMLLSNFIVMCLEDVILGWRFQYLNSDTGRVWTLLIGGINEGDHLGSQKCEMVKCRKHRRFSRSDGLDWYDTVLVLGGNQIKQNLGDGDLWRTCAKNVIQMKPGDCADGSVPVRWSSPSYL